jgi:hypothetical protein
LSSNWTNIFKTGNDTDHETLNTFRQFHCADCLHSFQEKKSQQQQPQQQSSNDKQTNENINSRMNTPPPPLLPITEDTINGLYHYFGQPNNQLQLTTNLRLLSNGNSSPVVSGANSSAKTNLLTDFTSDQLNLDSDSSLGSTLFSSTNQQETFSRNMNTSDFPNHGSIQEKKQCNFNIIINTNL